MATPQPTPNSPTPSRSEVVTRAAWFTLAVMFAMNLLNYIDRYIVSAVVENVQKEFAIDDETASWLNTWFLLSYSIFCPIIGWLGDRLPRRILLGSGVGVWSLATVLSGKATSFFWMCAARGLLGIGEATYIAIAAGYLSDLFPRSRRNQAITIFYIAIPVGAAMGYLLGGAIAAASGWRMAFYVVGFPGLVVALTAFFLPEPIRGATEEASEESLLAAQGQNITWRAYLPLLTNRSYVLNALGMACLSLALVGLNFWAPKFVANNKYLRLSPAAALEKAKAFRDQQATPQTVEESLIKSAVDKLQQPSSSSSSVPAPTPADFEKQFPDELRKAALARANGFLGPVVGLSGLIGTMMGGWLADRLLRRLRGAYFWLCGLGMLAGIPFVLTAFLVQNELVIYLCLFLGLTCCFMNYGPSNTIIVNVTMPTIRAGANAINAAFINLFGAIPSAWMMGLVSDASGNLLWGMMTALPAMALSGLFYCLGARYLGTDEDAVVRAVQAQGAAPVK
jgi:MFS family permease